jgi:SAM-dependent methyltransferase
MSTPDPTRRFSDRVADYVRYRPRYPREVLGVLREETGLRPDWVVADVGSGTGFSAEPFLDNGNHVYAVEPNAAMRAAAEELYGSSDRFHSVAGTAEDTGLEPDSVDLVVAAQAFHWFDGPRAREHFATILREPRWVALLWNTRRTDASPFLAEYEELLVTFGTDYQAVRHDRIRPAALRSFFGGPYARRTIPHAQSRDWTGLKGRLLSSSYTPGPDHPDREPMLARLRQVFERYQTDGRVRIEYDTEVLAGRLM